MKFTDHQKDIIKAIIEEKVYDIPSYLRHFKRASQQQYNQTDIQSFFEDTEDGRLYSFTISDSGNYMTNTYTHSGDYVHAIPASHANLSAYFREYPMSDPIPAQLDYKITPVEFYFQKTRYIFDFLNNSYLIANNFEDIKDFIALWCYLRNEALIFEVEKEVSGDDISIFFEEKFCDAVLQDDPIWNTKTTMDIDKPSCVNVKNIPYKSANNYLTKKWIVNYEHVLTCSNFITKKIIPTGALKLFEQQRFKTFEERSQQRNLFVAWMAVIISVISVVLGNLLPLLQANDANYLTQIVDTEKRIEKHVAEINNSLSKLEEELQNLTSSKKEQKKN